MQIATILPGQWQRYARYNYAVWVHRTARELETKIKKLPERPAAALAGYQKPFRELGRQADPTRLQAPAQYSHDRNTGSADVSSVNEREARKQRGQSKPLK